MSSSTPAHHFCMLWIHDDSFSEETVVYNSDRIDLNEGSLNRLAALKASVSTHDFSANAAPSTTVDQTPGRPALKNGSRKSSRNNVDMEKHADTSRSLVFVARDMTPEQKRKQSRLQVSIHANAAAVFGFRNNMQTIVLSAHEDVHSASHVEIVFRDQYLARADMWRLTVSELSLKSVYKGQKLLFLGSIKATVKSIYVEGQKMTSAFFSSMTKPIFRSESAKYVIFIQMSREMWDFDAEGSGEIMFNKVINGFLPELFKRWQRLNVRHLVSIIMFTRLEYEDGVLIPRESDVANETRSPKNSCEYRDFYRVVTTDAASSRWIDILYKLKKEFKVFQKDVSIVGGKDAYGRPPETLASVKAEAAIESVIAGQPTTSARGNILEAINLAAAQFSKDYIDRDLVHTGISLVIVTAGTGVFEVDYNMLKLTTDSLVASGIGVDLVSLARMPLHSVPLFRYRSPHVLHNIPVLYDSNTFEGGSTPRQAGYLESHAVGTPRGISRFTHRASTATREQVPGTLMEFGVQWNYALPHWIDVSFWTGPSDEAFIRAQNVLSSNKNGSNKKSPFTTSCRMYELQMMGLMENEMSDIAIPLLPGNPSTDRPRQARHLEPGPTEPQSESFGSTRSFFGYIGGSPRKREDDLSNVMDMPARKELLDWMTNYDKQVFQSQESPIKIVVEHTPLESSRASLETTVRFSQSPTRRRGSLAQSQNITSESPKSGYLASRSPPKRTKPVVKLDQIDASPVHSAQTIPKRKPMPRQISLGPRGLGTAKATPSVGITNESAGDLRPPNNETASITYKSGGGGGGGGLFSNLTQQLLSTLQRKPSQASIARADVSNSSDRDDSDTSSRVLRSNPIAIRSSSVASGEDEDGSKTNTYRGSLSKLTDDIVVRDASVVGRHNVTVSDSAPGSLPERTPFHKMLSPLTAMSPWLTMLNPSNPKKHNMSIASQFRRWQHVFPKPVPTSVIKWKSLCSPAALPLTAEYFPTSEQLRNEYSESPYKILPLDDEESSEAPKSREALIRELIACRLSHGFQIVVGPAADEFVGSNAASLVKVFDRNYMAEDGATVLMTIGNNIHQLVCAAGGEVEVRRYNRRPGAAVEYTGAVDPTVAYNPYIRTYLAKGYEMRSVIFKNPRPTYNWNAIDHHIAGYRQEYAEGSQDLRFWRARFVLIPVDHKIRSGQLGFVSENSDEEIRLEGIQKLTQIWQRHRYVPPEERRFQQSLQQRRKDPNPLAIEYHTHDPSMIVRSHATGLGETLSQGEPGHDLFAESDLYHTNDFDMQKLAQHLQADPPKGVPVADRRWHFRIHHKCFRGDHLTSFLLANFKDVQTREDAVKLGNALMKKGLFSHAMQKHQFRDGNYFYQITSEYRTAPYPEPKSGWFGMTGKSVPTTPLYEGPKGSPKFLPIDKMRSPRMAPVDKGRSPYMIPVDSKMRPRSGTNDTKSSDRSTPKPDTNKRPTLELSRVLRYDVDHRKKSYRPEIINLHYDRIHNPDNCYHIRLEWINVTAKLIEDAVVSWATSVERYGLKMVELPIAEGYAILDTQPFRRPYTIKLALPPPKGTPRQYYEMSQMPTEETFPYHRALARKFDFVLDYEAASTFDAGVDVSYSWGKPDYRYTQFIHKAGGLLLQIPDEGSITLIANRLYTDRSTPVREASKFEAQDKRQRGNFPGGPIPPHASPFLTAFQEPSQQRSVLATNSFTEASIEPEVVAEKLEKFCSDPHQLQAFYDEALRPTGSPSPHLTPRQTPRQTPVLGATTAIPPLGLPPSISLRGASFVESPRIGLSQSRRSSVQGFKFMGEQNRGD